MGTLKSDVGKIDKISDTQFNKTGIMLVSLRHQKPFIDLMTNPGKPVQAFTASVEVQMSCFNPIHHKCAFPSGYNWASPWYILRGYDLL